MCTNKKHIHCLIYCSCYGHFLHGLSSSVMLLNPGGLFASRDVISFRSRLNRFSVAQWIPTPPQYWKIFILFEVRGQTALSAEILKIIVFSSIPSSLIVFKCEYKSFLIKDSADWKKTKKLY